MDSGIGRTGGMTALEDAVVEAELQTRGGSPGAQGRGVGDGAGPRTVTTLGFAAPYQTATFTYEEGDLPPGHFRVKTLYTGLSAGTELTHFKGTNQYLHKTWDDTLK